MLMSNSEILIYQTQDGQTKIDVRLEEETVWLSQAQMVELFQTTKQNISLHIKNIYEEGELEEIWTVKDYLTVQTEGKYLSFAELQARNRNPMYIDRLG